MRGFFAIGVWHSKAEVNIGTLWRSAQAFGAAYVFTVGRRYVRQSSDCTKAWRHMPVFHFADIADLSRHLPYACRLVGVELTSGARSLPTYRHPESACYLLGAEDHGLSPEAVKACHEIVQIPGAARCLNVAVAGSIVLYDRVAKALDFGEE